VSWFGWSASARDFVAALATGQLAGLAMLFVMTAVAVLDGHGVLYPLRAIGSMGWPTLQAGAGPVLLGLLVHQLGFTLLWSLVFAGLVRWADRKNPFAVTAFGFSDHYGAALLGLLVGLGSNLVDVIALLPAFAKDEPWTNLFLGVRSWVYHLVFGLVLGGWPIVRRWIFG
jgi:hypothetical protein